MVDMLTYDEIIEKMNIKDLKRRNCFIEYMSYDIEDNSILNDMEIGQECSISQNLSYLYINNEIVGQIREVGQTNKKYNDFIERKDIITAMIQKNKLTPKCFINIINSDYNIVTIDIVFVLPEAKNDDKIYEEKLPKQIERNGKTYIRNSIKHIGMILNPKWPILELGFQFLLKCPAAKDNKHYISNICLSLYDTQNKKVYNFGHIYKFEKLKDNTVDDLVSVITGSKNYRAIYEGSVNYGKDYIFKIAFAKYSEVKQEKTIEDYPIEIINQIPETVDNRKRNKIKIWKTAENEIIKYKPGTKIKFLKGVMCIEVTNENGEYSLGLVDETLLPGDEYFNRYYYDIYERLKIDDLVYGVILDKTGSFAYASYRKIPD